MTAPMLTATTLWRTSPQLLVQLQQRLGDPLDTYVNGSQVWLREDGPDEQTIEWRLHPVSGYTRPDGMSTNEVFSSIVYAIANDEPATTPVEQLWDGLEAFSAFGDEIEPMPLRAAVVGALGIEPDAAGLVDHRSVGDAWERTGGSVSIVDLLFSQLDQDPA